MAKVGRPKADHSGFVCACGNAGDYHAKGLCSICYGKAHNARTYQVRRAVRIRNARKWNLEHSEQVNARKRVYYSKRKAEERVPRDYGISYTEYLERRDKQEGKCAICQRKPSKLVLDHDHETGKLREFLCGRCNVLLGWLESTAPEGLEAVINYLERHCQVQKG